MSKKQDLEAISKVVDNLQEILIKDNVHALIITGEDKSTPDRVKVDATSYIQGTTQSLAELLFNLMKDNPTLLSIVKSAVGKVEGLALARSLGIEHARTKDQLPDFLKDLEGLIE